MESNIPGRYWSPLPRPQFSLVHKIGIIVRNTLPAVGVFLFGWPAGQFLMLTQFNIALSAASIAVFGMYISLEKKDRTLFTLSDEILDWVAKLMGCLAFTLFIAAFLCAFIIVGYGTASFSVGLFLSALAAVVAAAPGLFDQYRGNTRCNLSDNEAKARYVPDFNSLMVFGGLIDVLIPIQAVVFGKVSVVLVTAVLIARDLRPDLMRSAVAQ
jgi:hypothetical protein